MSAIFLNERTQVLTYTNTLVQERSYACGIVLTGAPGRIPEAIEFLLLKKVEKLIISGVYKGTQLHEIIPQTQTHHTINNEDIILEKISTSTHQNAIQSLLVVQSLQCKSVLLITSQLHMYRAYRAFRSNFPEEIEIHTYTIANSTKEDSEFAVIFETAKSLLYAILLFFTKLFL